ILARGPEGLVYVAQQRVGIFRQAGTGWELLQRFEGEGGNLMPVSHMAVAPDGAVWCVFQRRRVARWKDGDWIELGHLPGGFADGGSMAVDGQGGLWLASEYRGVLWVDGRALEVRALGSPELEIPFERFDHGDGLGSLACSGRKGAITCSRDGRVWVATANGLSVIDPARWQELGDRSLDPPVHIEGVSIDGIPEALSGEQSAQISLDASVERFEIEYVSLEFLDPQGVQYYYQLDGFDNDWVAAGDRRTAQYQKLPPGQYSFLVTTKSGRIENSGQARITVSVLPAWWQRRSIRLFGLAVLVGCVWWLYSWRVGEVRRRRAAAEEFSGRLIRSQENERKRIAADLHDGIGQNLLVIKNRLLLAGKELGDQGSPPPEITDIIDVATESIREVRNVSHNLHPYKLERLGLTKAIQSAVRQVNEASEVAIDSDIDPIDGVFPKEREIIVYRIVQECLQNVIKHSGAETASVKIIRGPNAVTVKVADDGIGLSPAAAQPTGRRGEELPVKHSDGLGLKALNERARMLGGRCSWSTPEGGGTEFAFFFPIKQDPE
ncbi:MAG: ATP-binding protein, partial [Verrucomicrobiales bacterium]